MLDINEINDNWNKLTNIVSDTFSGKRLDNLLKMYDHFRERMAMAPASGRINYHSCFVGGYVYHVLNVCNIIRKIANMWDSINHKMKDFTDEEMMFVALHHDLGKVGDRDSDYYVPNNQDWSIKRGIVYNFNPELQYMEHNQRSLFLLQQFDITVSDKEYLAILLHDGMYNDSNKSYLVTYDPNFKIKTSLPFILHISDMICSESEYWNWKLANITVTKNLSKKNKLSENTVNKISTTFEELFG